MAKESNFQKTFIKELKDKFPNCLVIKLDANYIQGLPDLLVLNNKKWAALECKRNRSASHRPNQDFYVKQLNQMSYASFVYPENKEEVMNELQRSFES